MTESKKNEGLTIRIRLKAYDHRVIDQSARQIVDTGPAPKFPARSLCRPSAVPSP